ncbi:MAG: LppX_LprAFG lipoprotein [Dehalococcoidia bacterium]|nr:LppX_LprAFG lipoprotein [Dehalococcoidia bacterium]
MRGKEMNVSSTAGRFRPRGSSKKRNPGTSFAALLVSVVALATACSGGSGGTDEAIPNATPTGQELREMVDSGASAFARQESFHFELEDLEGQTEASPGLVLVWARGDVRVTEAVRGFLGLGAVGAPAAPLETEIRVIEGQGYATNPLSGSWTRSDASELPVKLDGLTDTIRTLMTSVGSLEFAGSRLTDVGAGRAVRGTIAASEFRVLFDGALTEPSATVVAEVVIANADGLPHLIEVSGRMLHSDEEGARRLLTLSRFGDAVEFGVPAGF